MVSEEACKWKQNEWSPNDVRVGNDGRNVAELILVEHPVH
jgi:hypothetical protein